MYLHPGLHPSFKTCSVHTKKKKRNLLEYIFSSLKCCLWMSRSLVLFFAVFPRHDEWAHGYKVDIENWDHVKKVKAYLAGSWINPEEKEKKISCADLCDLSIIVWHWVALVSFLWCVVFETLCHFRRKEEWTILSLAEGNKTSEKLRALLK